MPLSKVIHRNYPSMHSVLDVVLTDFDVDVAETLFTDIWQLAASYERVMSSFDPHAEVFIINQKAHQQQIPVSETLFEILTECRFYYQLTKGYFDIGLKRIKENPPIIKAGNTVGMETVELNPARRTIRFLAEETAIDLGGVGKGVLLREIEKLLDKYAVLNCFISFGGSSILTRGTHPHGSGWPVTLRSNAETDYTFYLNNHAASISESHPGKTEISHIIHPKKYQPVTENRMSFVQSAEPVLSEVLSTTLIIAPVEETDYILTNVKVDKALIFSKQAGDLKLIYKLPDNR